MFEERIWVLWVVRFHPEYKFQGPRFRSIGENSGEEFRESVLIPELDKMRTHKVKYRFVIDFSGTEVFTPSFMHEAFGGAVRKGYTELLGAYFVAVPDVEEKRVRKYMTDADEETND